MATISIPVAGQLGGKSTYSRHSSASFLTNSSGSAASSSNNDDDGNDDDQSIHVGEDILRISRDMNTLLDSVVNEVHELSSSHLVTPKQKSHHKGEGDDDQRTTVNTVPLHIDDLSISSEDSEFTADASIKRELGALRAATMELESKLKTSSNDSSEKQPQKRSDDDRSFRKQRFGMDDKEIIRRIIEEELIRDLPPNQGETVLHFCGLDEPESLLAAATELDYYPLLTTTAIVWGIIYFQLWKLLP